MQSCTKILLGLNQLPAKMYKASLSHVSISFRSTENIVDIISYKLKTRFESFLKKVVVRCVLGFSFLLGN